MTLTIDTAAICAAFLAVWILTVATLSWGIRLGRQGEKEKMSQKTDAALAGLNAVDASIDSLIKREAAKLSADDFADLVTARTAAQQKSIDAVDADIVIAPPVTTEPAPTETPAPIEDPAPAPTPEPQI